MPAKIAFNHDPKETLEQPKEQITDWKQTFANKNGFTCLRMHRYIDRWHEEPEEVQKADYYKEVWQITEENAPNVPGIELRSKDYHLDHIMPIAYGYKHGIDPSIIGALDNLQILTHRDNFLKAAKYKPELVESLACV